MNPALAAYLFRLLGTAAQVHAEGLTDELRAKLQALVDEGKDSILEPQDNGEPWTVEAIVAEGLKHDALITEIRARHSSNA